MKTNWLAVVLGIGILAGETSARAQAISEHFDEATGDSFDTGFSAGISAGVDPATNWNNLNLLAYDYSSSVSGLIDSGGNDVSTAFTLTGTNGGQVWYDGSSSNPDVEVTQNIIKASGDGGNPGTGTAEVLQIDNIPYSNYDLILYVNGQSQATYGGAGDPQYVAQLTLSGSGTTYYFGSEGQSSPGSPYTLIANTTAPAASAADDGNYIEITGLTGTSQMASLLDESATGNREEGITGFQIVDVAAVPEPSTYVLLGSGLAAFAFFRGHRRHIS